MNDTTLRLNWRSVAPPWTPSITALVPVGVTWFAASAAIATAATTIEGIHGKASV